MRVEISDFPSRHLSAAAVRGLRAMHARTVRGRRPSFAVALKAGRGAREAFKADLALLVMQLRRKDRAAEKGRASAQSATQIAPRGLRFGQYKFVTSLQRCSDTSKNVFRHD